MESARFFRRQEVLGVSGPGRGTRWRTSRSIKVVLVAGATESVEVF